MRKKTNSDAVNQAAAAADQVTQAVQAARSSVASRRGLQRSGTTVTQETKDGVQRTVITRRV